MATQAIKGGTLALAAATVVAAAAGTFFLSGTKGKRNRAALNDWVVKAKKEVLEKLAGLKEVDSETYLNIVDTVLRKYKDIKKDPKEVFELGRELKKYWDDIVTTVERTKRTRRRVHAR